MATILIQPVEVTTKNGSKAQITGIDVTDIDCLHGEINGAKVRWNEDGNCRNQPGGINIDTRDTDVSDILKTIDALKS